MAYIQRKEQYATVNEILFGPLHTTNIVGLHPCLLSYSPLSITGRGWDIDPNYQHRSDEIFKLLTDQLRIIAEKEQVAWYGFKNSTESTEMILKNSSQDSFLSSFTCFTMCLDVTFVSFETYLANLPKQRRYEVKKRSNDILVLEVRFI